MGALFDWLGQFENSKMVALVLFFVTYIAIVAYVFTGRRRAERLEAQKHIPFADDSERLPSSGERGAGQTQDTSS